MVNNTKVIKNFVGSFHRNPTIIQIISNILKILWFVFPFVLSINKISAVVKYIMKYYI